MLLSFTDSDPRDRQKNWPRGGAQVLHRINDRLPPCQCLRRRRPPGLRRHRLQGQQSVRHVLLEQAEGKHRETRWKVLQTQLQKICTSSNRRQGGCTSGVTKSHIDIVLPPGAWLCQTWVCRAPRWERTRWSSGTQEPALWRRRKASWCASRRCSAKVTPRHVSAVEEHVKKMPFACFWQASNYPELTMTSTVKGTVLFTGTAWSILWFPNR